MSQQQISFACLLKCVRPGGYYIIGDLQPSLREGYEVEPGEGNTTLTMIKLIAEPNSNQSRLPFAHR